MTDKKLSIGDKLGYVIGAFGDTVPLNILTSIFCFSYRYCRNISGKGRDDIFCGCIVECGV